MSRNNTPEIKITVSASVIMFLVLFIIKITGSANISWLLVFLPILWPFYIIGTTLVVLITWVFVTIMITLISDWLLGLKY